MKNDSKPLPASALVSDKPYHHGDLRRQILDEAARLLKSEGESGLSMRKLAQNLGVSRTAPYHHFTDKQALLCGVAEEGFRRLREVIGTQPRLASAAISEEAVRDFVRRYVQFSIDNAEYYELMFGARLWKSQQLTESLKVEAYDAFKTYLEQIRHWQQEIQNAELDPLRFAQVSWSTLHGMSRLLIDGIYLDITAINVMTDTAAKMFWQQLYQPE
ncbi:HTH-type transcriptional repressor AcnR [Zhongshania aliphaticivorans]|uniref:HTH-type transcriptional repressor AcnR n=1 Tax=Zhongshania aliphaticivorans TaxID=1470434 RepID=A0A5S9N522_9GAMM|nr:TetR/AcrR family transcriptional regulator [Zhongshania aliphaticivorans]CAA0082903.1 HTH-type transcriptional repressor AcnR [Zhongshania aliphaticivorans]CAA0083891.1 HTH-type transcriptional repressor AcnR [Zhongshania aliphaticivorans]